MAIPRHGWYMSPTSPTSEVGTPAGAKLGAGEGAQWRIAEIISPGILAADGSASNATKRRMTS